MEVSELKVRNRPAGSEPPAAGSSSSNMGDLGVPAVALGGGELKELAQTLLCVSRTLPFNSCPQSSLVCAAHRNANPTTMPVIHHTSGTPLRYFSSLLRSWTSSLAYF